MHVSTQHTGLCWWIALRPVGSYPAAILFYNGDWDWKLYAAIFIGTNRSKYYMCAQCMLCALSDTYTCIHTMSYIHVYMHTCIHTYIHTYLHACMHTYMHPYIRTYIHTYIYMYVVYTMHMWRHLTKVMPTRMHAVLHCVHIVGIVNLNALHTYNRM